MSLSDKHSEYFAQTMETLGVPILPSGFLSDPYFENKQADRNVREVTNLVRETEALWSLRVISEVQQVRGVCPDHLALVTFPVYGKDLDEVLTEYSSLSQKLDILERVCYVLQGVHRKGWLHLNVNPKCIKVDNEGELVVSLTGFSTARRCGEILHLQDSGICSSPYMAPETVQERKNDKYSDCYGIARLICYMFKPLPYALEGWVAQYFLKNNCTRRYLTRLLQKIAHLRHIINYAGEEEAGVQFPNEHVVSPHLIEPFLAYFEENRKKINANRKRMRRARKRAGLPLVDNKPKRTKGEGDEKGDGEDQCDVDVRESLKRKRESEDEMESHDRDLENPEGSKRFRLDL